MYLVMTMTIADKVRSALQGMRGAYTINFWILITTWIFFRFGFTVSETYFGNYVVALGASEATIGLFTSISYAMFAFTQLPGGYLADKYGRKWLVVRMTWLIALNAFLLALAPVWQVIPFVMILDGVSRTYIPALRAMFMDSLRKDSRAAGFILSNILPSIAAIPAPIIGGYIAGAFPENPALGYRINYLIAAGFAVAAAALRIKLRETHPSPAKSIPFFHAMKEALSMSFKNFREEWSKLSMGVRLVIVLRAFTIAPALMMFMPYLIRVARRYGIDDPTWGWMVSVGTASAIAISLATMPIADKLDRRFLAALGTLTTTAALVMFPSTNKYIMGASLALIYPSMSFINSAITAYMADKTITTRRGFAVALDNISMSVGGVLGGVIASVLFIQNPLYVLYAPAVILVMATSILLVVMR
jgi:MFS family permease